MNRIVTARRAALAATGAAVGAVGVHALVATGGPPQTGPARVLAAPVHPPGGYVRADAAYGREGRARLAAPVSGALMGPLSPVAVRSPDGRYLVYNSWFEPRAIDNQRSFSKQGIAPGDVLGTPSLRVYDTRTRADALLEHGAYSVAWRNDGALAYVRGSEESLRAGNQYLGQVMVRSSLRAAATPWTTEPARYVVYGWAGRRLVVYRLGLGERLELLVLDGPRRIRPLGAGSLIALSPDGQRAFVTTNDQRHVRILDLADGSEAAQLDLSQAATPLEWVAYSGSWDGDRIVAPASAGLAVFRVDGDNVALEQVLSLDRDEFPAGVQEPRFADSAGNEILATVDLPPRGSEPAETFFLDCDRTTRTCSRGEAAPARDWLRLVDNPSRPIGGDR